jgi:membrane protease YdiL (CAAX protease family)
MFPMSTTCQSLPTASAPLRDLAPAAGVTAVIALVALGQAQLATLLILAPAVEEIVFRAGLQEALMRRASTVRFANVLTALAFAAAHLALRPGWIAALTLLPALACGALYRRTRRILPCIVLHALLNAAWVLGVAGLAASVPNPLTSIAP